MKPVDTGAILLYLLRLRRRHRIKRYFAIIGGAFVSLLGPLCITLFSLTLSMTLISSYGFWGAYWLVAAVTLPIFFLIAAKLKGSVLERLVPDGDTLSGRIGRRWIGPLLVVAEIANTGPRLVLWGIAGIWGERKLGRIKLTRVAKSIADLTAIDSGVSPAKLLLPGENANRLEPLLAFLLYYEIADLSNNADRIWLTSETKRQFKR